MRSKKRLRNNLAYTKPTKSERAISSVISTVIISGILLVILVIASFASTNVLEAQMASTEFEQAKSNMMLLDQVIQDVALRRGSGGYVQFNQRTGGIGISTSTDKLSILQAGPGTLILEPNADGDYSAWPVYGTLTNGWQATSDNNDGTGVYINGSTTARESLNLQDQMSDPGTIDNVTAYMRAQAISVGSSGTETLYVDSLDLDKGKQEWTEVPPLPQGSPYLDNNTQNYIYTNVKDNEESYFGYTNNTIGSGTINSVKMYFEAYRDGNDYFQVQVSVYDGSKSSYPIIPANNTYNWASVDVSFFVNSWAKVDSCRIDLTYKKNTTQANLYIRRSYLSVDYNAEEKATILWKTNDQDYESQPFVINRGAFSTYLETRTTNPTTGGKWNWTELNALQIGCRASSLDTNEVMNVSEFWVQVNGHPIGSIYMSAPLTSLEYRAGSMVSASDSILRGTDSSNIDSTQQIGYLRVETGNGVRIELDYNRVRVTSLGTQNVLGDSYNFMGITFINVVPGEMGGSGTVNVRVQNVDTTTHTQNVTTTIYAEIGGSQIVLVPFTDQKVVVMLTVITIEVSTS